MKRALLSVSILCLGFSPIALSNAYGAPVSASVLAARIVAAGAALTDPGDAIAQVIADAAPTCDEARDALTQAGSAANISSEEKAAIRAALDRLGQCPALKKVNAFGGGGAAFGSLGFGGGGGGGGGTTGSDYTR